MCRRSARRTRAARPSRDVPAHTSWPVSFVRPPDACDVRAASMSPVVVTRRGRTQRQRGQSTKQNRLQRCLRAIGRCETLRHRCHALWHSFQTTRQHRRAHGQRSPTLAKQFQTPRQRAMTFRQRVPVTRHPVPTNSPPFHPRWHSRPAFAPRGNKAERGGREGDAEFVGGGRRGGSWPPRGFDAAHQSPIESWARESGRGPCPTPPAKKGPRAQWAIRFQGGL